MQVEQTTKLAEEGIKTISAIDDPAYKLLIITLFAIIVVLIYGIYKLLNIKVKDVVEEKQTIKKKDEIIEEKAAKNEDLLVKNIQTTIEFSNNVSKLTEVLQQISATQQSNKDYMRDHHEYFKNEFKDLKSLFSA